MNKSNLYLVRKGDEFEGYQYFATMSFKKACEFNADCENLCCFSVDMLSKKMNSNIDCSYAGYSVICFNTKCYSVTQL
ncbi:MAG: hypothetical protein RR054_04400 [Clostridia bacterium]